MTFGAPSGAMSRAVRLLRVSSPIALCLASVGCPKPEPAPPASAPSPPAVVYASFQPLAELARAVGGPSVEVRLVCAPEDDPARCQPSKETIGAMQTAALVLINGAAFEAWSETVSLSPARLVDTSLGFESELLRYESAVQHQHGVDGELHTHEGIDGHTWLDPKLAAEQLRALTRRFQATWPAQAADFEARQRALLDRLEALDQRHRALVEKHGPPMLFASHPAYNYLARRYGWRLVNLDLDPEQPLDAERERALADRSKQHPARLILFESEPTPELAAALRARLGLTSVVFSPAETPSPEGDYLTRMGLNLDRLEAALAAGTPQE